MTRRLLVVDDEERIREIVQVCLEDLAGWEVIVAGSAQNGLDRAKTESLDAILLDVSMPGMDGFTLAQQLQTQSETCSIPVILLTAKPLSTDTTKLAEMGIAGVIAKPFDVLTFPDQIADLLGWKNN